MPVSYVVNRLHGGLKGNSASSVIKIPYDVNLTSFVSGGNDVPIFISCIGRLHVNIGQVTFLLNKSSGANSTEIQAQLASTNILVRLTTGNFSSNYIEARYNFTGNEAFELAHYMVSYDASKTSAGLKLYRNNIELPATKSQVGTYTGQTNSYNTIYFIRNPFAPNNGGSVFYSYKLYNAILSDTERTQLFKCANIFPIKKANLVISYDLLNTAVATTVNDTSGNGLNGVVTLGSGYWVDKYEQAI